MGVENGANGRVFQGKKCTTQLTENSRLLDRPDIACIGLGLCVLRCGRKVKIIVRCRVCNQKMTGPQNRCVCDEAVELNGTSRGQTFYQLVSQKQLSVESVNEKKSAMM